MPLTRSDMPNLLEDGLKAVFFEALDASVGDYQRIATIVPSSSEEESYPWLGAVPTVREFVDERMPLGLLEHNYTIRNKTWESSIAVERTAIEDDKFGQIKLRVQSLAREVRRHMDELVFTLLKNGFDTVCYRTGSTQSATTVNTSLTPTTPQATAERRATREQNHLAPPLFKQPLRR